MLNYKSNFQNKFTQTELNIWKLSTFIFIFIIAKHLEILTYAVKFAIVCSLDSFIVVG